MNSQHTYPRRGPIRALVAAVLLAGVFTMHGLTGNHDVTMAMIHQTPAATAAHDPHPTAAHATTPARAHSMSAAESQTATPPVDSRPLQQQQAAATIAPSRDGHLHAMGDVCLAMLAALLLALIVALARRSLTAAHPVQRADTTASSTAIGLSPPSRRPTLSKHCILRT